MEEAGCVRGPVAVTLALWGWRQGEKGIPGAALLQAQFQGQ